MAASKARTERGKVRELRSPKNDELIATLEDWLEAAKRGEIVGALLLGNRRSGEFQTTWSGVMPASIALVAFESWKRRMFDVD
jgi:hypothetical protein